VYTNEEYTVYRIGRGAAASASELPQMQGAPLPVAGVNASRYQDLVGHMTDRNRVTRWHTGEPQDPTNEMTIDLGETRQVSGVEQDIAGYIADFPRRLAIETSLDGTSWAPAWSGGTALLALSAALEQPLDIPLRFPFEPRPARYVRLRQTGTDDTYYWSIAELRVYGQ
jgi:hypothetical protein